MPKDSIDASLSMIVFHREKPRPAQAATCPRVENVAQDAALNYTNIWFG